MILNILTIFFREFAKTREFLLTVDGIPAVIGAPAVAAGGYKRDVVYLG